MRAPPEAAGRAYTAGGTHRVAQVHAAAEALPAAGGARVRRGGLRARCPNQAASEALQRRGAGCALGARTGRSPGSGSCCGRRSSPRMQPGAALQHTQEATVPRVSAQAAAGQLGGSRARPEAQARANAPSALSVCVAVPVARRTARRFEPAAAAASPCSPSARTTHAAPRGLWRRTGAHPARRARAAAAGACCGAHCAGAASKSICTAAPPGAAAPCR